ncbi:MAG: DNA polymerase IV [Planctomycetes bacterium]|nr:DNA polymerase IV [Planctomycetota bacterium]
MILHVDMDAFYASVEERDQPELAGKPLIVGGSPRQRGVVCAANYAVRRFGVHSAMPTATALRLCPHATIVRPRLDYYATISDQIRQILERYTPQIEPLSLDEAFLDVTGSELLFGKPADIGRRIQNDIRREVRLVASVGVAPNKFLAKIASDLQKPNGFVVVPPHAVQEFLDPLPVGRLWGVGKVTGAALERLGVRTIRDVRLMSPETLQSHFGKSGEHLWQLAHGHDDRQVIPDREAKSISHETTFAMDLDDREALRAWLMELSDQVGRRLRRHGMRGKTVHLKVRYANFQTITRSQSLANPTQSTSEIWQPAAELLDSCLSAATQRIRLLGVGVSGFGGGHQVQQSLFPDAEHAKQSQLDQTADLIREKFGSGALHRGSGLLHGAQHRPQPRPETGSSGPDASQ